MRELSSILIINENGQRRRISKMSALIKQAVNKAISGDPATTRILFRHLERRQTAIDAVADAQPVRPQTVEDLSTVELMQIARGGLSQVKPSSGD
jgi:hypothetical protein